MVGWLELDIPYLDGKAGWKLGPLFREKAAGNCFFLSERQGWLETGRGADRECRCAARTFGEGFNCNTLTYV